MSEKTKKSETIVVRLEPQLSKYIENLADSRIKKSAVVRRIIKEFYIRIPENDAKQIILGYKQLKV